MPIRRRVTVSAVGSQLALVALVAACSGSSFIPEDPYVPPVIPPPLTFGTFPEPQPITIGYADYVADASWHCEGGDQLRNHRSTEPGLQSSPHAFELFAAEGTCSDQPAVGADGTCYIASGRTFRALSADGEFLWHYKLSAPARASAAVAADGRVYIGDDHGVVYGFHNGHIEGKVELPQREGTGGLILSPPSSGPDGTLYVVQNAGLLTALSPDCEVLWTYESGCNAQGVRALSDGSVLLAVAREGTADRTELILLRDGEQVWNMLPGAKLRDVPVQGPDGKLYYTGYNLPDYIFGVLSLGGEKLATYETELTLGRLEPYSIGQDGTVYACSAGNSVLAFTPSGRLRWERQFTDIRFTSAASVAPDGNLYAFGASTGSYSLLACISPAGKLNWLQSAQFAQRDPVVAASGRIVASNDGAVYGFNADGTLAWQRILGSGFFTHTVSDRDGHVYLAEGSVLHSVSGWTESWRKEWSQRAIHSLALSTDSRTLYALLRDQLYAYDTNGTLRWAATPGDLGEWYSILPGIDGTLLIRASYGRLRALHADGSEWWTYTPQHGVTGEPAIDREGRIYLLSESWSYGDPDSSSATQWQGSRLSSLARNGALRWEISLSAELGSDIMITNDDCVLLAYAQGEVRKYDPEGELRWQHDCDSYGSYTLAEADDGTLLVLRSRYRGPGNPGFEPHAALYALSAAGNALWQNTYAAAEAFGPLVDSEGKVYVIVGRGADQYDGLHVYAPDGRLLWEIPLNTGSAVHDHPQAPLLVQQHQLLMPHAGALIEVMGPPPAVPAAPPSQ